MKPQLLLPIIVLLQCWGSVLCNFLSAVGHVGKQRNEIRGQISAMRRVLAAQTKPIKPFPVDPAPPGLAPTDLPKPTPAPKKKTKEGENKNKKSADESKEAKEKNKSEADIKKESMEAGEKLPNMPKKN
eukprot:Filipodium_phascolosomae@DN881_c0_g1_i2.p1